MLIQPVIEMLVLRVGLYGLIKGMIEQTIDYVANRLLLCQQMFHAKANCCSADSGERSLRCQ